MACVTGHLSYDPTDANSVAASATIGSYVLAGDDGTEIGHVSDALKVDIGSVSDLDIRDLIHTQDSIALGDGSANLVTVTNVASDYGLDVYLINTSIAVTATDLDIRDLTAVGGQDSVEAWAHDGTGTAITSTGTALDVNIASGDIDDSLANVALENTSTAVSTSAVSVVSSALANRKWLALANEGNIKLFIGKSGVTTANGFPMYKGDQQVWRIGPTPVVQAIGNTGASSEDLRVMELS